MLKRFAVANFSSFDDMQVLDLTAGSTRVLSEHVVEFDETRLLKSAVIYGANASGKSNLIKAVDFSRSIILNGLSQLDTYKKHFRLSKNNVDIPTNFEFELEVEGVFYSYGFSLILSTGNIIEEWLYSLSSKGSLKIFERSQEQISLGNDLSSSNLKTRFEIYIDDMKNQRSQLFLSEIAEKELELSGAEAINQVFDWFANRLDIVYPDDKYFGFRGVTKNLTKELTKYLSKFDTGVVEISSIEESFEDGLKGYPDVLKARIIKDFANEKIVEAALHGSGKDAELLTLYKDENQEIKVRKLVFLHGNDETDFFELKEESDGTRRLLDFIPLLSKFAENHTVLVDEFDRSLHPKLTREYFNLFYGMTDSKSQLIVSTHESTLLDLELLRRDEIWFVEKSHNGSSKLFSLNSFKERYDKKVEKAYLLGRYGAVPIFKSFQNIAWED